MKTLAALLALTSSALAQEPPRPPERPRPTQDAEARERSLVELRTRIADVKTALASLPKDSPERGPRETELRRLEEELRRLQQPRPPEPPGGRNPGPPPGEGPPFPPGAERRRPVSNPEEVRAWIKEHEPESYRRLMAAQEEGRRPEVMDMLAAAEGRMHGLNEMKARDPKGYERLLAMRKLEQETVELGEKARQAAPEERERLSAPLKEKLAQLFDLREEARARELEELRRRVGDLEKALAGRKANKERIVENRRRVLLGERPDDEW
jgi:hypothetical protein